MVLQLVYRLGSEADHIHIHIKMKLKNLDKLLNSINDCPSKWELDNIIWGERTSDPKVLVGFLQRIDDLRSNTDTQSKSEKKELEILTELLEDLDESEARALLNRDDDESKDAYIERLARISAIEVLSLNRLSFETMTTTCKLSPNDFILCAKRTQDLINAIQGLVIKGETLSRDVSGA